MINLNVECVKKDKKGAHIMCEGRITGNGGDIRREMVAALQLFDEVAGGKILCDAFEEFMEIKIKEEDKDDDN